MINQEEYLGQALARWCLYRFLAIPFQYPEEKTLRGLDWDEAGEAVALLGNPKEAFGVLRGCPKDPANLQSEYLKIFGNIVGTQCPPYETQYHGAHIFMQAQELADIAGFYRAWGLDLSEQAKERVDHIWVELEFMSYLAFKEAYAAQKGDEEHLSLCRESQTKFLGDHLARWVPAFTGLLEQAAGSGFYGTMAMTLREFVASDAKRMDASPDVLRPQDLRPVGSDMEPDCSSCGVFASDEPLLR